MANIQSNKKRHEQDKKKKALSHSKISEVRTTIKKVRINKTDESLEKAYSVIDKAAKNNRIHKNKANRTKSRLATLVNAN
ncbi:MAG: 30S ribosomal protein S20 [Mycoplasma sp.]